MAGSEPVGVALRSGEEVVGALVDGTVVVVVVVVDVVVVVSGMAVFVSGKLADGVMPLTDAVTMNAPMVSFAVSAGVVAIPSGPVTVA